MTHNNPADWNVFDDQRTLPGFVGAFPDYTLNGLPDRDLELVLIKFTLLTGAAVANRYARIYIDDGVTAQTIGLSTTPVPASETRIITFGQGLQDSGAADCTYVVAPLITRLRLGVYPVIHLNIVNGQVGDSVWSCVIRTNLYLKTPQ